MEFGLCRSLTLDEAMLSVTYQSFAMRTYALDYVNTRHPPVHVICDYIRCAQGASSIGYTFYFNLIHRNRAVYKLSVLAVSNCFFIVFVRQTVIKLCFT